MAEAETRSVEEGRVSRPRLMMAILLLGVIGVAELLSFVAIQALETRLDEPIRRVAPILHEQRERMRLLLDSGSVGPGMLDTLLGWSYRPGYDRDLHLINGQGIRSAREYAPTAPVGSLRVAAFGDSFVYGHQIPTESTWAARIEFRRADVEVLNFGVGGYGVDQALLRYAREGGALGEHVVLMGFSEDNLSRTVNVYRRFRSTTEDPISKPRFVLDDANGLRLLHPPLGKPAHYQPYLRDPRRIRELGRHDYWYSRLIYQNPLYDWSASVRLATTLWVRLHRRHFHDDRLFDDGVMRPESDAFRIQVRLFRAFADSVRARGAVPALVFFPSAESIRRARSGAATAYATLRDSSCVPGLQCFDAVEAFASDSAGHSWFKDSGHYTGKGNDLIAAWLAPKLSGLTPR